MNALRGRSRVGSNFSYVHPKLLIAGISSTAFVILSVAINHSLTNPTGAESSVTIKADSTQDGTTSDSDIKTTLDSKVQTPLQERVTVSPDGSTTTRQFRSESTDKNGNTVSQEQTYTTNIDGESAIDISLESNSSSNGTATSNSNININVNSSSTSMTRQE